MTAITVTEVSYADEPMVLVTGTARRRVKIFFRGTVAAGGSGTHNLATNIPGLAGIEGVDAVTDDGVAQVPTDVTWSTTTITVADVGAAFVKVIGYLG
jgi:hypothetical protein